MTSADRPAVRLASDSTAFGASAAASRRFAWLAAAVMTVVYLAFVAQMIAEIAAPGFGGEAIRFDFTAFWAAAKLALAGEPEAAFDPERLHAAMALPPGLPPGDLLWLYPPGWHMAVAPLGALPFPAAYIVYSAVTLAAFAAAVRPLAAPLPGGVPLTLAAPAVLTALILGNNSLLWTAGMVGALAAMAGGRTGGRAALAGLLIALLTLKPQLGLLVPVALAAGGHWRVALWAALGTVAVVTVSTAAMGAGYWQHFFATLEGMSVTMASELVRFERMMTWYALARVGGAPHDLALPVQLAISLAAAAAIAWVWKRPRAGLDIKAAALLAAIPVTTPYAYHYEMTLTLGAALFLARDGFGARRWERAWLLALWLGPLVNLALAGWLSPAIYAAPLVTATLVICVLRAGGTWPAEAAARPGPE